MKKNLCKVMLISIVIATLFVMNGCKTEDAKKVDAMIDKFLYHTTDFDTLHTQMDEIDSAIDKLSNKEKKSLELYDEYQEAADEHIRYENETVAKIEEMIAELPAVEDIKLADGEAIDDAESKYDSACKSIQERISNAEVLEAARERLEKHREECWVDCTRCGGYGKVTCSLCGGSGSRWVNHTTPNGKTWRVTQDCKTTSSCGECGGKGGIYVEE